MTTAKCPKCGSYRIVYVCRQIEEHSFEDFAEEDNYIELIGIEDSFSDDTYENHCYCHECMSDFDIHGKELKD